MNKSQGSLPVVDPLSRLEDLDKISPAIEPNSPDHVELVQSKIGPDRSSLARSVLFICKKCEGALVPASTCTVCKKTLLRVCVRCGLQEESSNHNSCKYLIILSERRAQRLSKIKKDESYMKKKKRKSLWIYKDGNAYVRFIHPVRF